MNSKFFARENLFSRIHPLKAIPNCWIKRDDELPFDNKTRKYTSLIDHMQQNQRQNGIIIGTSLSNHIVAIVQILRQMSLGIHAFLLKSHHNKPCGNQLLTSLLLKSDEVTYLPRSRWRDVENIAQAHAEKLSRPIVIPEGAFMPQALLGALTLGQDIIRNEKREKIKFKHLFISSGSGLTAFALLLYLSHLNKPCKLHIISMTNDDIQRRLTICRKYWEDHDLPAIHSLIDFQIYRPSSLGSFGVTNAALFAYIKRFAQIEGIFLDPIYNAKLFIEGEKILKDQQSSSTTLFIHTGGQSALHGFSHKLIGAERLFQ